MKVLEVMERTGMKDTKKCIIYIRDALSEIQSLIPEKTTGQKYNVVANQRLYSFPTNMVALLGVYKKYETDTSTSNIKYIRIPRVQHLDLITQLGSTAADSETDIIVV